MPRKTKTTAATDKAAQPQFSAELLEQLIPGPVTPPAQTSYGNGWAGRLAF